MSAEGASGATQDCVDAPPPGPGIEVAGRSHRIHVFGASGTGTSTLGRLLAMRLGSQHFDADDLYWYPTDPPFRRKRPPAERRALAGELFLPRSDWVLSGAMESWAADIPRRFTLAVFLTLPQPVRRARLEARERLRHGKAADRGGAAHEEVRAFLAWADGYEHGRRPGRSLARHEAWIATLPCPVLRLDATPPPERLAHAVLDAVARAPIPAPAPA
ncbi:AAA family ATPase [Rhodovulum sp. 12E13]|uniref:AAA family ATPase n=1 Tax=Rhodovulum sp. 12E13 TaxID=2203891 RepID=UPI0018F6876B|nr:AAA family ATPase [Rhodovulum sp. 12E13]